MVTNIQENIRTILSSANYGTAVQCAFAWPIVASQKKDKLEDKAKGVASVWWADFIQFLAALGVLPRSIRKNRMNLTFSLK